MARTKLALSGVTKSLHEIYPVSPRDDAIARARMHSSRGGPWMLATATFASALFGFVRSRFSAADPKKPEATELQKEQSLAAADTRKSAEGTQVCAFA